MPTPHRFLSLTKATSIIHEAGFGARSPGFGLELEWFVTSDGEPETNTQRIRAAIESSGPLPHSSRITFEPGGQLEISAIPSASGPDAIRVAADDADEVMVRLAAAGMRCHAIGVDAGPLHPRVLDDPRYRAMDEYFRQYGRAGNAMMCNTASLQINVRYSHDINRQWHLAHDCAPVLAAIFAHSPLVNSRPSGWQSARLATWAALDPSRTRPVAGSDDAREDWTRYALDAPVMFLRGDDECVTLNPSFSLRQWIAAGHALGYPTAEDVSYHLTTLFPPIRPRGWLEVRVLDALGHPWWNVAAAVTMTAITDPEVGEDLAPIVRGCHAYALLAAWKGVHDARLREIATSTLAIILPALAGNGYDNDLITNAYEFAARYTQCGRSLADDRLDAWALTGTLTPEPVPLRVIPSARL